MARFLAYLGLRFASSQALMFGDEFESSGMKEKTPQEKKALSYAKDRRNSYGANDKASRNSIPKRKAEVNRVFRKRVSDALKKIGPEVDLDRANEVEDTARSIKRIDWKKFPDSPLGEVVEQKLQDRVIHAGRGKSAAKKLREFMENLEVEFEQIELNKWVARAKQYPWISVKAVSRDRAREKLMHLMAVAKRNELYDSEMRVQIDGEFVTPTLSK